MKTISLTNRGHWPAQVSALLLTVVVVAGSAFAQRADSELPPPQQWDPEVVKLFSTLPIQDGGRVKPLSTFAGFTLLKINGTRAVRVPGVDGNRKLGPTEWLLDTMFYPEAASRYKVFLVQSSEVLDAIGVSHADKKKRDRYSYAELEPGIEKLFQLAQQYHMKSEGDSKNLTPIEGQIVDLASNVFLYQKVVHYLDFARYHFHIEPGSVLSEIVPAPRTSAVLAKQTQLGVFAFVLEQGIEALEAQLSPDQARQLREALPPSFATLDAEGRAKAAQEINTLMQDVRNMTGRAIGLALFPPNPQAPDQKEWLSAANVFEHASHGHDGGGDQIGMLVDLEELVLQRDDPAAFKEQLRKFHAGVVSAAMARGEYAKVPLEVSFYKMDYFYKALILYVLAFLVATMAWMTSRRWVSHLATIMLIPPTILVIVGITMRCIIRSRPPVSTLYETILFIAAVAVVVAIIIEFMNRQRIAMSVGAVMGAAGMFLAYRFEAQQGVDTMPQLVAVLDTNFWLSTHVTTVTMGYSAGLLAAAMAHVYILGRLFNLKRDDKQFYKSLYRMTYGVVCFGLVFSTVGTVLGGIWANESWGRFWGWDPKENGALMIVLWNLAILHARLGGYIRDLGLAIASTFGAIIVAFSWWGVNLLGVGLHSYGFTSGIMPWLITFYLIELFVVFLGFVVWYREKFTTHADEPVPVTAPAPAPARKKQLPAKAQE